MLIIKPKHTLILMALLFSFNLIHAQKHEIGLNIIAGATSFKSEGNRVYPSLFSGDIDKISGAGLSYHYKLNSPVPILTTGINFETRQFSSGYNIPYLNIPFGIELNTETKLFFSLGAGLNLNFLLNTKEFNAFEKFYLGAYINTGLGYRFNNTYSIVFEYQLA